MVITLDTLTLTYTLAGTILIACISFIWAIILHRKINRLLGGTTAKDLSNAIKKLHEKTDKLACTQTQINTYLTEAEKRLSRSIQGIAIIRFNPFKGQGGGSNQSFATALVNENGDGVIISSLYSRDRVGVYAKPIENLTSVFELTKEERSALKQASDKCKISS